MADVKGDLAGLAKAGSRTRKLRSASRNSAQGLERAPGAVVFWDLYGEKVTRFAPRFRRWTAAARQPAGAQRHQEGVLYACFKIADDQGLLLLDLKDLAHCSPTSPKTPNNSRRTMAISRPPAWQRSSARCWCWKQQGAENFFGERRSSLKT